MRAAWVVLAVFVLAVSGGALTPAPVGAQDLDYSFGNVVRVDADQVVIMEYDYDTDEEVEVVYTVNGDTKFTNIASLQDVAKDDNLDIHYRAVEGKRVATMVAREELTDEAGEADDEYPENLPMDIPVNGVEAGEADGVMVDLEPELEVPVNAIAE